MSTHRPTFPALVIAATALASFGAASPAHADCIGLYADKPHLETKADGRVIVQGYGGVFIACPGGATLSVCLDFNGATRVDTCRSYSGEVPQGATAETPCITGVWHTQVIAIPNSGAPQTVHSSPANPLIVTPLNCPVRAN